MRIGHVNDVERWLEQHGIDLRYIKINAEGDDPDRVFYVDVDGDLIFRTFNLDDVLLIPKNIKFRTVTGRIILGNEK